MQFINQKTSDYDKINFNLKIHSKDRSLESQKNPFNFGITFNPAGQYYVNNYDANGDIISYNKYNYSKYNITSRYEKIKSVKVTDMIIPSKIYTKDNGYQIKHVKILKTGTNTAKLFIQNSMAKQDFAANKITLTIKKKEYMISTTKKENLLIIKSKPYFITSITDGEITFTENLEDFNIVPLYLGIYNNNTISENPDGTIDDAYSNLLDKSTWLIDSDSSKIIEVLNISNNKIISKVIYPGNGNPDSKKYNLIGKNYIKTYDEKCFFLKFKEFKQIKDTSRDNNINQTLAILYPYSDGPDYTILMGKGEIDFLDNDLKNFNNLNFVLLDSRGNEVGTCYNNFTEYNLQQDFHNIILNIEITILKEKFN